MPEPTATTSTAIAAAAAVPALTVFGESIGLAPGLLVAGALGSFVAMVLLNTVPDEGRTLFRSVLRRMSVLFASSITAGYLTPLLLELGEHSQAVKFGIAFVTGGGAQWILLAFIKRFVRKVHHD